MREKSKRQDANPLAGFTRYDNDHFIVNRYAEFDTITISPADLSRVAGKTVLAIGISGSCPESSLYYSGLEIERVLYGPIASDGSNIPSIHFINERYQYEYDHLGNWIKKSDNIVVETREIEYWDEVSIGGHE